MYSLIRQKKKLKHWNTTEKKPIEKKCLTPLCTNDCGSSKLSDKGRISMLEIFLWVIFPYITLTIMIVGLFYRFAFRQLTWAAPSTEFFEKKWLRIGSPLFHYGIILAFIGHVMGMVIPQ